MAIKVIITGSTGMIGKGVLLECLDSSEVSSVLVINRNPVGIAHEKLREIICEDLFHPEKIRTELPGYDACFFCLGISAAGLSEEKYRHITLDLTLNFAQVVLAGNPDITFCYVSGAGTDSTEQGRMMWARIKGKTENELLKLPFKATFMFRPGYIQPMRGLRSRTSWYNAMYFIAKPFYPLFKGLKNQITNTEKIGRAMINVALKGYPDKILEIRDINKLADG